MPNMDVDAGYAVGVNVSDVRRAYLAFCTSHKDRATPSIFLVVYLVGVADPSLTSEGLAIPLLSLGSAVAHLETSIITEHPLSC